MHGLERGGAFSSAAIVRFGLQTIKELCVLAQLTLGAAWSFNPEPTATANTNLAVGSALNAPLCL
jgi:hypothetical protein